MEKENLIFNEDMENYNGYNNFSIYATIKKNKKNAKIAFKYVPKDSIINVYKDIDVYKIFLEIVDPDMLINEKIAEGKGEEYKDYKYDFINNPEQYQESIDFLYQYYDYDHPDESLISADSIEVLSGFLNINRYEYQFLKITDPIEFEIPLREFDENDYERIEYAIQKGYYIVARSIILNNINYCYYFNEALHEIMLKSLIDNNNKKGVLKIIGRIRYKDEVINENGYNLLHYAIASGNFEMTKFLLSLKSKYLNINQVIKKINSNKYKYSPLMLAIETENLSLVKLLIDNGAKINYYYCYKMNGLKFYKSPIYCAIQKENLSIINLLFKCGLNPNKIDEFQFSPLLYAASHGKLKVVNFLCSLNYINKKIIINSNNYVDKMGYTALHFAAENGNKDLINLLILNNLFLDTMDSLYQTPLTIAAKNNNYDAVELLIERGANLNIFDLNNATPLFYAIKNRNKNMIKILAENDAKFNLEVERDCKLIKLNLFIDTIKNRDKEMTEFLLSEFYDKIEINAKNNIGKTALTEAICNKDIELAKNLIINYRTIVNDIDIKEAKKISKKEFVEFLKNCKKEQEVNSINIG